VVKGKLRNCTFNIEEHALGNYDVYRAVVHDREDTRLVPTGQRVRRVNIWRTTYAAGSSYAMRAGTFHESEDLGPAVTIIHKDGPTLAQGGPAPRVLVPHGVSPDNTFNRYSVEPERLWAIVAEVLFSR
jgi:hypothetical protein